VNTRWPLVPVFFVKDHDFLDLEFTNIGILGNKGNDGGSVLNFPISQHKDLPVGILIVWRLSKYRPKWSQ